MSARRAIVRWSWRMLRREWRQQVLVLALLTFAVGVAVLGGTAAYNVTPSRDAEFGDADRRVTLGGRDADTLEADQRIVEGWFADHEVIGTAGIPIPGSTQTLELRSQDPAGPLGRPMLALRTGRYPTTDAEVAITDDVASRLTVGVGDRFVLGELDAAIVGLVENPADLADEFVLVRPGSPAARNRVTLLVAGASQADRGSEVPRGGFRSDRRGDTEKGTAAALSLALATVVLLLVCLVAAAGFAVLAQRRLRQLGLLAAIGATPRQLRLVVVANGALIGAAAAVAGTSAALAVWRAFGSRLEESAGHRFPAFDLPWWLVVAGMALAVLTATTAAWLPARTVARVPITLALAERPPRPVPSRRSASLAVALGVAGVVALALGVDNTKEEAVGGLVIGGVVALAGAIIFGSPIAVRLLARVAPRLPVAPRLALRDLGRYQARSGAALAAISLGLAMAVAIVVLASASEDGAETGNLPEDQVLVRLGTTEPMVPERPPGELAGLTDEIDRLAATLHADVVPLHAAVRLADREGRDGRPLRPALVIGRPIGDTIRDLGTFYVATPAVVAHLGLDPDVVEPAQVLTAHTGPLAFANALVPELRGSRIPEPTHLDASVYTSTPRSLVTEAFLAAHGMDAAPYGWIVVANHALSAEDVAAARELAVANGLTIESRDRQGGLATVRSVATAGGALLALSVLAMTVGLIRSESGRDVRTLAATGAARGTRRTITAATAFGLALLGVVIGIVVAYAGIVAAFLDDLSGLERVPFAHLAITVFGVPLAAAAFGWLLAGREPTALGHSAA